MSEVLLRASEWLELFFGLPRGVRSTTFSGPGVGSATASTQRVPWIGGVVCWEGGGCDLKDTWSDDDDDDDDDADADDDDDDGGGGGGGRRLYLHWLEAF